MSKIFCIVDGMTDENFFPMPNLSRMELTHYTDTCQKNPAETLNCVLSLLGKKDIPENLRGYVEALGSGIPVESNDLLVRGSWFNVDSRGNCSTPCDIAFDEDFVKNVVKKEIPKEAFEYHFLGKYKCLMIFHNKADEVNKIRTSAPCACAGQNADLLCPEGSEILKKIFNNCLGDGRVMVPWGQSAPAKFSPFDKNATVITATPIVKGIASLLKMDLVECKGATGDIDTNLSAKVNLALKKAEEYPFVLLHINGADEAAHRKNSLEKQDFLQKVDEQVIKKLLESNYEVVVVSDHGTSPLTGLHIGDLQPVFVKKINKKAT